MHRGVIRLTAILSIIVAVLLCFSSCHMGTKVIYYDADGTKLAEIYSMDDTAKLTDKDLPEDNSRWHYTRWKVDKTNKDKSQIVIRLEGVRRRTHRWMSLSDTLIKEEVLLDGEEYTSPDLPADTDMWHYDGWTYRHDGDKTIHTIVYSPKVDYFKGNCFKIMAIDRDGEGYSLGTGFVIDSDGTFITNYHVLDNTLMANATFNVGASSNATTTISIAGGLVWDRDRDIFIGRLGGYARISEHFHEIPFTSDHAVGERAFAIGYPSGAELLTMTRGAVTGTKDNPNTENSTDYYITSSAKIEHGSSGGVLVNANLEVMGITSIGVFGDTAHQQFISGGIVPTSAFTDMLAIYSTKSLTPLENIA